MTGHFDKLEARISSSKDPKEKMDALIEFSWEFKKNDFKKAYTLSEEARLIALELNDKHALAKCHRTLGFCEQMNTNYDKAIVHLSTAINLFKFFNDDENGSITCNFLGKTYAQLGEYESALEYFYKSLELSEKINDFVNISNSHIALGIVHNRLNNLEKADEHLEKSKEVSEKNNYRYGIGLYYTNKGMGLNLKGKKHEAINNWQRSLEIFREHKDLINSSNVLGNLGVTYRDLGEYDQAEKYLTECLEIKNEIGDKYDNIHSYNNLGVLYSKKNNLEKALEYLNFSLTTARELKAHSHLFTTHLNFSNVYKEHGNFEKALYHYEEYVKWEKKIQGENLLKKAKALEIKYEVDKVEKENEIYRLRNIELANANAQISQQKDIIEEKNKEITDSIRYAKRIQEAILPDTSHIYRHLRDSFIYYKPKDIVSGDFYWFARSDDAIVFAVADCTGHGVPGAFMSMVGNDLLNHIINDKEINNPGHVLNELDIRVKKALKQSGEEKEATDGMDIALCAYLPEKNILRFSGAYRPLLLIRNEMIKEYSANKFAIGGHAVQNKMFTEHEIVLEKGDCIYLFSDGYTDQFGGESGKKFKTRKFKEMLLQINKHPMKKQSELLSEMMESWKGDLQQVDDILVMGVRF